MRHLDDFERPTTPEDYRSGFFGANFTGVPQAAYENWIAPGDRWHRIISSVNADGSPANPVDIAAAEDQWQNIFGRAERWRIRLHHLAELKWPHITNDKVWVYYTSAIPAAKKPQLVEILDPGSFEFLGHTFAEMKAKLNARQANLIEKFFPGRPPNIAPGEPDVVVSGWEADFGVNQPSVWQQIKDWLGS